jgi:hypothetical protein
VADADPAIIGSEVGDGDAAEMGTDGRAHQDLGVSGVVEADLADLVEKGGAGVLVLLLVDLLVGEPADEDGCAVPDDLEDLSGRNCGDINLKIGVPVVAGPAVESPDHSHRVQPTEVGHRGVIDCAQHIDLGAPDVGLVLVMDSVLIEPVVDVSLEVDVVSEVAGAGRGHEETVLVRDRVVYVQLLVGPLVVLGDQSEVECVFCMGGDLLPVREVACLSRENNIYPINNIFKSIEGPEGRAKRERLLIGRGEIV